MVKAPKDDKGQRETGFYVHGQPGGVHVDLPQFITTLGRTETTDNQPTEPYISPMTREEMDAKIAATEARMEATEHRIDAALARLEAGSSAAFAEINTTLRHLPTSSTLYATVGGAVVVGILAVIAVLSFGGDRFDGGVQLTSASVQAATDAQALSKQNAQQIEYLTGRIDDVLKALAPRQAPPSQPAAP